MPDINVNPPSQEELSRKTIKPYGVENYSGSVAPANNLKKRELNKKNNFLNQRKNHKPMLNPMHMAKITT